MIGSRLRKLRVAKGLTQKQIAEPNYSHAYVSVIESGRRQPSRTALEHFASKLAVDVEELATGRPHDLQAQLELRLLEGRVGLSAGRRADAENTFRSVAKEAKRYDLKRIQAKAEEGLGLQRERDDRPEEALEHYRRAELILRGEPPTALVDVVDGKARCFQALGDARYAAFLLESLLDAIEREHLRDPIALGRLHAGLVYCYLDLGLHAKAAESAVELERLIPKVSDPARLAQMHMNVARLYMTQGKIEDSLRSLQRAEDAYRSLHLRTETGGASLARGYVMSREGRLPEAHRELEQALEIFEETSNEKNLVRAMNELGRVERLEGNLDRARELLERVIAVVGDADAPTLAWAHRELGITLAGTDAPSAEKHLRVGIELFERIEQPLDVAVSYRWLGDLPGARGDDAAGCEAYRTGILAVESHL